MTTNHFILPDLQGKKKTVNSHTRRSEKVKQAEENTCYVVCKSYAVVYLWTECILTGCFYRCFSQRSDVEESPASVYETDEEESDTVSIQRHSL